jgi:GNAT superfamily N-acetyltransferase
MALFAHLSDASRYQRFLAVKTRLTEADLDFLTHIDHVCHEALAAVDRKDGSIVGVARYVQSGDGMALAEVAIAVADDRHRRGIGLALARALIVRARANGFARLCATTLRENRAARGLARRVGFVPSCGRGMELELELRLAPGGIECS